MTCVVIVIDGWREDHISPELTPFLHYLKSGGSYASLDVSSSFYTPAEIATGNSPVATDTSFDFCFDPQNSPFKFSRFIKLPVRLRYGNAARERIWHRLLCIAYSKTTGNWVDFPPNIPLPLLRYFTVNPSLIEFQKAEREESGENLSGILRGNGISVRSVSGYAAFVRKQVRREPFGEIDVLMLHYQDVDKLGHRYGPASSEVRTSLRDVDSSIEEVNRDAGEYVDFIMVFGDHNMEEVTEHIDLWRELKKLTVKMPQDYVVFLNTPVARFWFKSEKARDEVRSLLGSLSEYGREVTREELNERGFPSHEKYGELIFWLNKGVAITPDFYHEYPILGMHFYFDYPASTPLILFHKDSQVRVRNEGKLRDVMPTILDLLNIQDGLSRDGTSLLIRE